MQRIDYAIRSHRAALGAFRRLALLGAAFSIFLAPLPAATAGCTKDGTTSCSNCGELSCSYAGCKLDSKGVCGNAISAPVPGPILGGPFSPIPLPYSPLIMMPPGANGNGQDVGGGESRWLPRPLRPGK